MELFLGKDEEASEERSGSLRSARLRYIKKTRPRGNEDLQDVGRAGVNKKPSTRDLAFDIESDASAEKQSPADEPDLFFEELQEEDMPDILVKSSDGKHLAHTGSRVDGHLVHASDDMLDGMKQEVKDTRDAAQTMDMSGFQSLGHEHDVFKGIVRCPLCPFYWCSVATIDGKKKWRGQISRHLKTRHTLPKSTKQGKASGQRRWGARLCMSHGTRQHEVARVLFNADRLIRKTRMTYLQDSARVLRLHLPDCRGSCDHRNCRLLLTRTDVRFVSPEYIRAESNEVLTLGYTHVTKGFAELFFSELLLNDFRVETTRNRLITHFLRCGCRVGQLLPLKYQGFWLQLMEKLLKSSALQTRRAAMLQECVRHEDCTHAAMDGLIRPARRIQGQADYRASKQDRDDAPIGDCDAIRRLVNIRSRTGAVLAIMPISSNEKADEMASVMKSMLPTNVLRQIRTIASDNPSHKLFRALTQRAHCTSLQFLTGDPTHLCFKYEAAHGRRRTEGANVLRLMQAKFNRVTESVDSTTWGPPYLGKAVPLSPSEQETRNMILKRSMPLRRAKARLSAIDGQVPYWDRSEYMQDMAALCAVYADEVKTKTAEKSARLSTVLWRATKGTKVGYYFNHLRRLTLLPPEQRAQLASGTTSVEVLNKELNNVFRHVQSMFQSTLLLGCDAFSFGKLLTHNVAEYSPTDVAATQAEVLAHNMAAWRLTTAEWQSVRECPTNLWQRRQAQASLIRKKPAAYKPPAGKPAAYKRPASKQIKRHTFNKKRVR